MEKRYNQIDKNIYLNVFDSEQDYIGTRIYAEELQNKLLNYNQSNKNKPYYIGVSGKWGTGKTTIVNSVLDSIDDMQIKKFKIDAWRFEGDSFRRNFIKEVISQIDNKYLNDDEKKKLTNDLYESKNIEISSYYERAKASFKYDKHISPLWLLIIVPVIALILVASIILFTNIDNYYKTIFSFFTTIISLGFFNIFISKTTYISNHLFSPEQFYDKAKKLFDYYSNDNKTIIILIDNLDRCDTKDMQETFSTIKGFFELPYKMIYIIPFDKDSFSEAYNSKYYEYSEKIFDDTVDIIQYKETEIISFLDNLIDRNSEYNELFNDKVKNVICRSRLNTPRQIIDLCNLYITEYNINIIKTKKNIEEIDDNYLQYLAKYSILKKMYNKDLNSLDFDSKKIERLEDMIKKNYNNEEILKAFSNEQLSASFINFLKRTYSIVPENYDDYYTNKNISGYEISSEIEDKIFERNYTSIYEYIESENKFDEIEKYLYNSIRFDDNNDLWEENISSKISLIIDMYNKEKYINWDKIKKYDFILSESKFINNIVIKKLIDTDEVIKFSKKIYKMQDKMLFNILDALSSNKFSFEESEKLNKLTNILDIFEKESVPTKYKKLYKDTLKEVLSLPDINMYDNFIIKLNNDELNEEDLITILDKLEIANYDVVHSIYDKLELKYSGAISLNLFNSFITFSNKIFSNDNFEETDKCLNFINNNIRVQNMNAVNNLSTNFANIPPNKKNIISKIIDIYLKTNNQLLDSRINLFNVDEANLFYEKIKDVTITSDNEFIMNKYIQFLSVVSQSTENYIDNIVNFYKNNITKITENFYDQIFVQSREFITSFFSKLHNTDVITSFKNKLCGKSARLKDDIRIISIYEKNKQFYNELLNKYSLFSDIQQILENTNKDNKRELALNKLMECFDIDDDLYDVNISDIEVFLQSNKISSKEKCNFLITDSFLIMKKEVYDIVANNLDKLESADEYIKVKMYLDEYKLRAENNDIKLESVQ